MNVLATFGVILLLAFLIEALVEAILGVWINRIERLKDWKPVILAYSAFAVGVVAAFVYRFDLVYLISAWLQADVGSNPLGIILTGLSIGRGSHFIHDIFKQFVATPPLDPKVTVIDLSQPNPNGE